MVAGPTGRLEPPGTARILRFGPYSLDESTHELSRDGRRVRLPPQPARVLWLLAERAGMLVTREELRVAVWGTETFVDFEQGLNFCVKRIRAALHDDADHPRYVETVPRRGYRFIGPVEASRSPLPPPGAPAPVRHRRVVALGAVLVAGLAAALWLALRDAIPSDSPAAGRGARTIAVLPFDNLSGDAAQDYFTEGFTEETVTQLARANPSALSVVARASMAKYRSSERAIGDIGAELGVDYMVEGSIRRSGARVRVAARVIRVSDGMHVWADVYERDVRDVLTLQQEVAHDIAGAAAGRLLPGSPRARRTDPEVYQLYLKGRFFWNQRRPEGVARAKQYFQQAVDRDPAFAPAYAGLGDCHLAAGLHGREFAAALADARRALALDGSLAEAHVTAGHASMHALEWTGVESTLQRAIELDPTHAPARYFYAEYLVTAGRFDEALAEARQAVELEPASAIAVHAAGVASYYAGRYDEAARLIRTALELDPQHRWSHARLGQILEQQQRFEEAVVEFEAAGRRLPIARAYARAGRVGEARQIVDAPAEADDSPYEMALLFLALGDPDRALEWLDRAVGLPHYDVVYLGVDPKLSDLRTRPRFQAMLRRTGLARSPDAN